MTVWEAAVLGFVQGATEFLPVSSSGHLVVTQSVLGTAMRGVRFGVAVHVATLSSILIVYRARIADLVRGVLERDREALAYVGLIVTATIPIVIVGGLAQDRIEALFDNPMVSGVGLLVTGAVLWSSRGGIARTARERPAFTAAVLIGLAQVCALVPGISRSGTTVVAALWARGARQGSSGLLIPHGDTGDRGRGSAPDFRSWFGFRAGHDAPARG